jgi:hypothetical protein
LTVLLLLYGGADTASAAAGKRFKALVQSVGHAALKRQPSGRTIAKVLSGMDPVDRKKAKEAIDASLKLIVDSAGDSKAAKAAAERFGKAIGNLGSQLGSEENMTKFLRDLDDIHKHIATLSPVDADAMNKRLTTLLKSYGHPFYPVQRGYAYQLHRIKKFLGSSAEFTLKHVEPKGSKGRRWVDALVQEPGAGGKLVMMEQKFWTPIRNLDNPKYFERLEEQAARLRKQAASHIQNMDPATALPDGIDRLRDAALADLPKLRFEFGGNFFDDDVGASIFKRWKDEIEAGARGQLEQLYPNASADEITAWLRNNVEVKNVDFDFGA